MGDIGRVIDVGETERKGDVGREPEPKEQPKPTRSEPAEQEAEHEKVPA